MRPRDIQALKKVRGNTVLEGCKYLGGVGAMQQLAERTYKYVLVCASDGITLHWRYFFENSKFGPVRIQNILDISVDGADTFTRDVSGLTVGGWGTVDSGTAKLSSVSYLSVHLASGETGIFQFEGLNQMKLKAALSPWWAQVQSTRQAAEAAQLAAAQATAAAPVLRVRCAHCGQAVMMRAGVGVACLLCGGKNDVRPAQ
jgi:hypothetical protein